MTTKTIITGLMASLISLSATLSHAAIFTEGTDYSDNPFPPSYVGNLTAGSNTISGSIATTCISTSGPIADCSSGDELDSFSWSFSGGFELVSATLSISNYSETNSTFSNFEGFGFLGDTEWQGNGLYSVDIENDIFANTEAFIYVSTSSLGTGSADIGWDYTLTLNVAPSAVPVPAAAWLFGSALLGLFSIQRRKHKS